MTKKEILTRIAKIENIAGDDEAAHSAEDSLREDFIAYVASRKDKLGVMAQLVLSTNNIHFARWCA